MTWKTAADCSNCGGSYELTVWDLGFKESDSISCPCCGSVLREWKKEPHSFTVTGVTRRGSIPLTDNDLPSYVGRRIRIEKGTERHEGIVKGLGQSVMATGPTTVARPWLLQTNTLDVEFIPADGWQISLATPEA